MIQWVSWAVLQIWAGPCVFAQLIGWQVVGWSRKALLTCLVVGRTSAGMLGSPPGSLLCPSRLAHGHVRVLIPSSSTQAFFISLLVSHLLMSYWPKEFTQPSQDLRDEDSSSSEKGRICGHFCNLPQAPSILLALLGSHGGWKRRPSLPSKELTMSLWAFDHSTDMYGLSIMWY